jgi:hypothetical protein
MEVDTNGPIEVTYSPGFMTIKMKTDDTSSGAHTGTVTNSARIEPLEESAANNTFSFDSSFDQSGVSFDDISSPGLEMSSHTNIFISGTTNHAASHTNISISNSPQTTTISIGARDLLSSSPFKVLTAIMCIIHSYHYYYH